MAEEKVSDIRSERVRECLKRMEENCDRCYSAAQEQTIKYDYTKFHSDDWTDKEKIEFAMGTLELAFDKTKR